MGVWDVSGAGVVAGAPSPPLATVGLTTYSAAGGSQGTPGGTHNVGTTGTSVVGVQTDLTPAVSTYNSTSRYRLSRSAGTGRAWPHLQSQRSSSYMVQAHFSTIPD